MCIDELCNLLNTECEFKSKDYINNKLNIDLSTIQSEISKNLDKNVKIKLPSIGKYIEKIYTVETLNDILNSNSNIYNFNISLKKGIPRCKKKIFQYYMSYSQNKTYIVSDWYKKQRSMVSYVLNSKTEMNSQDKQLLGRFCRSFLRFSLRFRHGLLRGGLE